MSFVESDSLHRRKAARTKSPNQYSQSKANYSIKSMARLLKVSWSGYHKRPFKQQKCFSSRDDRATSNVDVARKVQQIWSGSDKVYDSPRITAELTKYHRISLNHKAVSKRMRLMGIKGISPRSLVPVATIQANHKATLPDLVNHMFDTGELNPV